MQEALDSCLSALDPGRVAEVARNLCGYMSRGVGLATRVSAAKSLSFLAEKYPGDLGPHAVLSFRSLLSFLVTQNRMDSLRKTVLTTLGTLAKIVPEQLLEDRCFLLTRTFRDLFKPSNETLDNVGGGDVGSAIAGKLATF